MTTIARRITGGVDTHLDMHVAAALDERGAELGVRAFRPRPRAIGSYWIGSRSSGPSSSSGWKGPAATGPGSPGICSARKSPSSRSTGPTASAGGGRGSPIPTMRWPRPGPPRVGMPPDRPRPGRKRRGHEGIAGGPALGQGNRTQALNQMRSLIDRPRGAPE